MGNHLERIKEAVIKGKHADIEKLVQKAVDDRVDLDLLINEAMIGAMDVVGKKFSEHEIFVPEMLVSSHTMKKGLDVIKPLLKTRESEPKGTILVGTVHGDIHDIGKNLVAMMLEGAGFRVVDLGVDQTVENIIEKIEHHKPDILGLSAMLTTTMPGMKQVIESLAGKGMRDRVKVMVGGSPVDKGFAEEIGADGYGEDASEAVRLARNFLSE